MHANMSINEWSPFLTLSYDSNLQATFSHSRSKMRSYSWAKFQKVPHLNRAERPSNQTGQIKLSPFAKWENSGPLVFNEVNGFSQSLQATGAELCIDPSLPGLTFSPHHSFSNVEQQSVSFLSRACILSGEARRHSGQGKTYTIPPYTCPIWSSWITYLLELLSLLWS